MAASERKKQVQSIARRPLGKTGVELSIIGLGGLVLNGVEQSRANNLVAEAFDRGVNYFDVAPSYGDAESRLGPALEPYRVRSFLACKTLKRDRAGAAAELEQSLRHLRTDHFDLYQFHALNGIADVDQLMGPNGALETFVAARQAGKVRYLGFSAHSAEAALAALDRFAFDTILFPINFVCYTRADFGPQVMKRAQEQGVGILAIKAMAPTKWPESFTKRPQPAVWYQPEGAPKVAVLGLRWTLAHPVTSAVPPHVEDSFRLALDTAPHYQPLSEEEEKLLLSLAVGAEPMFRLGKG